MYLPDRLVVEIFAPLGVLLDLLQGTDWLGGHRCTAHFIPEAKKGIPGHAVGHDDGVRPDVIKNIC